MNDLSSNGITFDYKLVGRVSSEIMKTIIPTLVLIPALLIGCGMSDEEKANVAAVTCSVMGETRNMDLNSCAGDQYGTREDWWHHIWMVMRASNSLSSLVYVKN